MRVFPFFPPPNYVLTLGVGTKLTPNFEFCLDTYFKFYDHVTWIYNWESDMESLKGLHFDHKGTQEVNI